MARNRSHARWEAQPSGARGMPEDAGIGAAPTRRPAHTAPPSIDPAELAAGCALSDGFRLLHHHLSGLPTSLRALLDVAQRGKLAAILSPPLPRQVATVTPLLHVIPAILTEWETSLSVSTAQLLCAHARRLLAPVVFTRQFLRTQAQRFHESATAGTSQLPDDLCAAAHRAIRAAEDQIRTSCHRLVETHRSMVPLVAQEYRAVGIPDDDLQDLMQDGYLSLLAAAELFDVRAGASFRTYATWWLRQSAARSLRGRRIVVPPRKQQRLARQLTRTTQLLEQLLTRTVSLDELAAATGMHLGDIATALATRSREISLDQPLGNGRSWADILAAPDETSMEGAESPTEE